MAPLTKPRYAPMAEGTGHNSTVVDPRVIDHAVGLELQIIDAVERSCRAQVQGDPVLEAAVDEQLEELYSELSNAATEVAVADRPLEERCVAIEVAADHLDADDGGEFDAQLEVLRREVAAIGGDTLEADGRYGGRFCVRAPDLAAALDQGIEVFHHVTEHAGLPHSPVVRLEAPTVG